MIRPVRPTDVALLRSFLAQDGAAEVTTHTWPKVAPESGHFQPLTLLGACFGRRSDRVGIWLAEHERKLSGYAVVRSRCDRGVWDVEHLITTCDEATEELLEHAGGQAIQRGGRRLFLEVPADSDAVELTARMGFQRYASSTLMRLSGPFSVERSDGFSARPRLRADEHQLYQLYNAVVPSQARAVEAMSYEEWASLHRGAKRWAPSLFGDRQQFVWEMGAAGLIGWFEVVYGQKSQFLDFMVHPRYESMLDRLIRYALTQTSEKAPIYVAVRDYQPALCTALERASFNPVGQTQILVRQLAVRAVEPRLARARVVGN